MLRFLLQRKLAPICTFYLFADYLSTNCFSSHLALPSELLIASEEADKPKHEIAAIGVIPIKPLLLFDLDHEAGTIDALSVWAAQILHEHDIYETQGGYHVVALLPSWDEVQRILDAALREFPKSDSIPSCRRQRLRISPKWDYGNGEISPEPKLLECHCIGGHRDKRKRPYAERVGYWTETT